MSLTTSLTRTQASKVLEGGWDCGGREGLSYVLESVRPFISLSIDISTDHPHTSASIFLLTGTLASTGKRYTLEEDEAQPTAVPFVQPVEQRGGLRSRRLGALGANAHAFHCVHCVRAYSRCVRGVR